MQLQYQINLAQFGLEENPDRRKSHDDLLRLAFQQGRPLHLVAQAARVRREAKPRSPAIPPLSIWC